MLKKVGKKFRATVQTMSEKQAGMVCFGMVFTVFLLVALLVGN